MTQFLARVFTPIVKARSLYAFFWLAAFGCVWATWDEVHPFVGALSRRDPLITYWPRGTQALPLAVVFFAFAGMGLCPVPEWAQGGKTPRRRKPAPPPGKLDPVGALMLVAVGSIPFVFFLPPVAAIAADAALTDRGYRSCPSLDERPYRMRWALPSGRCPTKPYQR